MSDLIRRAREALVNVTPGPWHHDGHTGVMASGSVDTYSGPVWATIIRAEQTSEMDGDGRSWETSGDPDANARFIAAARDLVPAMADRLEAQEALLKKAMAVLERCPPTSNPTLTAEYNLERIEAWWRLEVRPVLAKP